MDLPPYDGGADRPLDPGRPQCITGSPRLDVRVCVFAADGKLVTANAEATVTVTAVDDTMSDCDVSGFPATSALFRRLAVETAGGTKWTVLLRIPDLPAAQVAVGQSLEMTVTAAPTAALGVTATSQTVVFSRQGALVAFASNLGRLATYVGSPGIPLWTRVDGLARLDLLPNLHLWDLALIDKSPSCFSDLAGCGLVFRAVGVSWAGTNHMLEGNETVRIGTLSLSLERYAEFLSQGSCDANSRTRLGGFVANP